MDIGWRRIRPDTNMSNSDSDSDESYKLKVRCPVLTGKKKDWPDYKREMIGYMYERGYGDLLEYTLAIPKDNKTYTTDEKKQATVKLAMKVRKQNKRAYMLLLFHIDKKKSAGKEAYDIVKDFMSESSGYASGNFGGRVGGH